MQQGRDDHEGERAGGHASIVHARSRATVTVQTTQPSHERAFPVTTNPVLVEAWRDASVESFHRGAFVVIDAQGGVLASAGDIERPVFPRSAIKLLQALPLVESGAADRAGLAPEELALACASHSGEAAHTRVAASTLAKAGLDADALECGTHWP